MRIDNILTSAERHVKELLEIDTLPHYEVEHRKVSLVVSETKGFDVPAAAKYDIQTGMHTVVIADNLPIYEYLLVHELTHVWDDETYTNGELIRYLGLRGYTEYHASQNELMFLLGLRKGENKKFSMKTQVEVLAGKMTVEDYIEIKYKHASELFKGVLFEQDVEVLITSLGALFNYFGLRSICKMYSFDYKENVDNTAFLDRLSVMEFVAFNQMMQGWLNDTTINTIINGFAAVASRFLNDIKNKEEPKGDYI